MPSIRIIADGDGAFHELSGKKIHHVKEQFTVFRLEGGMQSGNASVGLVIPLPDGSVVFVETSLELFVAAARAFNTRL